MQQVQKPVSCLILASRQQYDPCQICVPDIERPLAAIAIGNHYYSFFRSVQDSQRALMMMTRLSYCGDQVAIKKTSRGYGIWVREPEGQPKSLASAPNRTADPAAKPAPFKILISKGQYEHLQVMVPDLDQPLEAIAVDGRYYSIFRVETDTERVLDILAKTAQRGDETVAFKTSDGYAICVAEPEAIPL